MRNPLIDNFFEDKLTIDVDINIGKEQFKLKITFKKKINSFLFDKMKTYITANTSDKVCTDEKEYDKISDFIVEIVDEFWVGNSKIEIDSPTFNLSAFVFYFYLIIIEISKMLDDLKKK